MGTSKKQPLLLKNPPFKVQDSGSGYDIAERIPLQDHGTAPYERFPRMSAVVCCVLFGGEVSQEKRTGKNNKVFRASKLGSPYLRRLPYTAHE